MADRRRSPSRAGVEALAASARRTLVERTRRAGGRVAAYRGGYLPEERRELERALRPGDRRPGGTNALELGVDISGLDAVLLAGWPGTRASLWQQAGRAGRAGTRSLAVFVAADDPLDTYVVHHPEVVFGQPVEATVLDPDNPHVLAPHLAAAAAELPLREADLEMFGDQARGLVDALVARGILRRRPTRLVLGARRTAPPTTSRCAARARSSGSSSSAPVGCSAPSTRRRRTRQVHTGAVHVHQGRHYVVTELDLEAGTATAVRGDPGWSTFAQSVSAFDIVGAHGAPLGGRSTVAFGTVRVHTQVTCFLRRLPGGEVIGTHPLTLPLEHRHLVALAQLRVLLERVDDHPQGGGTLTLAGFHRRADVRLGLLESAHSPKG